MGDEREIEAPFNMAIATLKRLDIILQQIRQLDIMYPSNSVDKQKSYMNLVKQFYINAIPLFPKKDKGEKDKTSNIAKLGEEIISMTIKKRPFIISGGQKIGEVYDGKLDVRLNEILIELQQKLKKFFMPGKEESGMF